MVNSVPGTEPQGRGGSSSPSPPRLGLGSRIVLVFTGPGRLGDSLREHPAWFWPALIGGVLVVGATAAIPVEVWAEFFRAQAMQRGGSAAEGAAAAEMFRIIGIASAALAWFVVLFVLAGLVTFVFGFILGDEGSYRRYLSALAHANLIGAAGALLVTPLKIARRDPQLTLSVGTFVERMLADGFLYFWLRGMDLFAIWAWVTLGVLVSRMDARRSSGSAVAILLSMLLAMLAVVAWIQARQIA